MAFGAELRAVVDHLFRVIPTVTVSRLGLRYVNALKSDVHGIRSIADLAIKVSVGDQVPSDSMNLNFKTNVGTDFETMSRIASVDLAEGIIPENATVIVDIDVYTGGITITANDVGAVNNWVAEAHDYEKVAFFSVLGEDNTERLREK